ncbi:YbaY family lipoprotein [Paludibacterium purpuratum]|uniref:Type III secretion system (T3SS) chaperone YscW n=1 Tax=Paludibacterium purpuratum TaxID=1144873 RepID=A0A4R7BEN6_9NEIS|nr:YbaY family lipoprotein [Paludibacterium purpuratum]TDR82722.1 type III secretion system (T3SS) chaperone YscW [Paludibacterium purpuratum]
MLQRFPRLVVLCVALLLGACAGTPYQPTSLNGNIDLPAGLFKDARNVMVRQRLMDVSGSGGAAAVLSEQFLNHPKKTPLVYALIYDRRAIRAGGHYEVDTQVYANGELKWHASQTVTGTDSGLPATVDIRVAPVAP